MGPLTMALVSRHALTVELLQHGLSENSFHGQTAVADRCPRRG